MTNYIVVYDLDEKWITDHLKDEFIFSFLGPGKCVIESNKSADRILKDITTSWRRFMDEAPHDNWYIIIEEIKNFDGSAKAKENITAPVLDFDPNQYP